MIRSVVLSLSVFLALPTLAAPGRRLDVATLLKRVAQPGGESARSELIPALLDASAGEEARSRASAWTTETPGKADAWFALGLALEHDLVGRKLKPGADEEGARAAFRRALQIDETLRPARLELALLLATHRATRGEAIAELQTLRSQGDPSQQDLLCRLLLAEGRPREVLSLVAPDTPMGFAATVRSIGADVAIRRLEKKVPDQEIRRGILERAARTLREGRFYAQASRLMIASLSPGAEAEALRGFYAGQALLARHESVMLPNGQPGSVVLQLVALAFGIEGAPTPQEIFSSRVSPEAMQLVVQDVRAQLYDAASSSPDAAYDLFLSQRDVSSDGLDSTGYRVDIRAPGTMRFRVVRENDAFRVLSADVNEASQSARGEAEASLLAAVEDGIPGRAQDAALRLIEHSGGISPLAWFGLGYFHESIGLKELAVAEYGRAEADARVKDRAQARAKSVAEAAGPK